MNYLVHHLIEENRRTKSTFLDLGNCDFTELPETLFDCVWLVRLNLGVSYYNYEKSTWVETQNRGNENHLSSRALQQIKKLTNLQSLDLRSNQIEDMFF